MVFQQFYIKSFLLPRKSCRPLSGTEIKIYKPLNFATFKIDFEGFRIVNTESQVLERRNVEYIIVSS